MKSKTNWAETRQRFLSWWSGSLSEAPLLSLIVRRDQPAETLEPPGVYETDADLYLNIDGRLADMRNRLRTHRYEADAFPSLDLNLGPGSVALYLGSPPIFKPDTVWYGEVVPDTWRDYPLVCDPENVWWKKHFEILRRAKAEAGEDFYINIPDLIENIDILAAMRGPQNMCYDLMDDPEIVHRRLDELDRLYFKYYDALYKLLKDSQGGSSYTAFHIYGPGKTGKVQCDFSAMMSPDQFSELIAPSIERQCRRLTFSMYHLDGKDAIKHVPALMAQAESLNALQWTAGAGQPDGGDERWYPIYDQVRAAGKSLWISFEQGDVFTLIEKARKLVRRYGHSALYILFPIMEENDAKIVLRAYARGFK